jgi:hypothetical protein
MTVVQREFQLKNGDVVKIIHANFLGKYTLALNGYVLAQKTSFVDNGWKKRFKSDKGGYIVFTSRPTLGGCCSSSSFAYKCELEQ